AESSRSRVPILAKHDLGSHSRPPLRLHHRYAGRTFLPTLTERKAPDFDTHPSPAEAPVSARTWRTTLTRPSRRSTPLPGMAAGAGRTGQGMDAGPGPRRGDLDPHPGHGDQAVPSRVHQPVAMPARMRWTRRLVHWRPEPIRHHVARPAVGPQALTATPSP